MKRLKGITLNYHIWKGLKLLTKGHAMLEGETSRFFGTQNFQPTRDKTFVLKWLKLKFSFLENNFHLTKRQKKDTLNYYI